MWYTCARNRYRRIIYSYSMFEQSCCNSLFCSSLIVCCIGEGIYNYTKNSSILSSLCICVCACVCVCVGELSHTSIDHFLWISYFTGVFHSLQTNFCFFTQNTNTCIPTQTMVHTHTHTHIHACMQTLTHTCMHTKLVCFTQITFENVFCCC